VTALGKSFDNSDSQKISYWNSLLGFGSPNAELKKTKKAKYINRNIRNSGYGVDSVNK